MKQSFVRRFISPFFGRALDLRVRLFNILATAGVFVSLISAVAAGTNGEGAVNVLLSLLAGASAVALIVYASRSGRYQLCYGITIVLIFFILFPLVFFMGGGIDSSVPFYFIFAVLFTISMLDGKKGLIMAAAELAVYIALFAVEWRFPDAVTTLPSKNAVVADKIIGLAAVSVALGVTMYLHFRSYIALHRRLDEQNAVLAQISRAKTEFLANTSHEMRTPLTVVSVNIQKVMYILEDMERASDNPEATRLLTDAQGEIMRLSRMVGGMLTLASISENPERRKTDFTALLQSASNVLELFLQKRGNRLETELAENLMVFCDSDLLSQVIVNLLQNAHGHTENDAILLRAVLEKGKITVTVRDNGTGIAPDLLPRVFERGVSDGGGTGVGLYLCKTVIESHGGAIWIDSTPGAGTIVRFTLPVYEGQYGGDAV